MDNLARLGATFAGVASFLKGNRWARLGVMFIAAMAVVLGVALTQIGPFDSPTARVAHAEGPGTGCSGCHASAIAYVDVTTCTSCHDGTGAAKPPAQITGGPSGLTVEMDHHIYPGEPGVLDPAVAPGCYTDCHMGSVANDVRYVAQQTASHTWCFTGCHDQVHDP